MKREERWGTRMGLVLAMAGNAVGLGNFLRFPAQAAQNGGGAFIIPYVISFLVMGIPLLWIEWGLGRHGGQFGHHSPPGSLDVLGKHPCLKYLGIFGLFNCTVIAGYYCYVESWTLSYVFHSLVGTFQNQDPKVFFPSYLGIRENSLFAFSKEALFWFLLTLGLNIWVLSKGLVKGIERVAKVGMPLLFLFGIVLVVRGLTLSPSDPLVQESPWVGLNFVWEPNFSGLLNPTTWLAAAGQIFFTLSVGMGCVVCYASYVKPNQDIVLNSLSAGWMNEFAEVVLGGTILIPIAVAYLGLDAIQTATSGGSGFSLAFLTLPTLFQKWGWFSPFAGALWFGLLFIAGVTSSLALGQPMVAFFQDALKWKRTKSSFVMGGIIFVLGLFTLFLFPAGAFDEFDFWASTFGLVAFAMIEVFVFLKVFGMKKGWKEILRGSDIKIPKIFPFFVQYVTPLFLIFIFIGSFLKPALPWLESFDSLLSGRGWPLAGDSILGKLFHVGESHYQWFTEEGKIAQGLIQDMTRLLLVIIFVALIFLVRFGWRNKKER